MLEGISSQTSLFAEKSLGPWLSAWAIRSKWNLDYKLSPNANLVRWAVVIVCYSFAPRSSLVAVRASGLLTGLSFLCWPNFAYHLTRLFEKWPTTEGTVNSSRESGSRWSVSYYFEFNGEQYGGTSKIRPLPGLALDAYSEGSRVVVRYDPWNPDN